MVSATLEFRYKVFGALRLLIRVMSQELFSNKKKSDFFVKKNLVEHYLVKFLAALTALYMRLVSDWVGDILEFGDKD